MGILGLWVIEVEVIVMFYMLNILIFIFEDSQWLKYSGNFIDKIWSFLDGVIYLNYVNRNYYDVVVFVFNKNFVVNYCVFNIEIKVLILFLRNFGIVM